MNLNSVSGCQRVSYSQGINRVWTEIYATRTWHYNGDMSWEGTKPMVKVDVKHNTTITGYV